MAPAALSPADHAQLAALGITPAEVEAQLALFRNPPPFARLVRPCRVGDGVKVLPPEEHPRLLELYEKAERASRLMKMVPASGAASRMFQSLARFLEDERTVSLAAIRERAARKDKAAAELVRFLDELDSFPFAAELRNAAGLPPGTAPSEETFRPLLAALLTPAGLGFAGMPKALIPFHAEEEGARTSFEEHLVEAALTTRDAHGVCRVHFTVPEGIQPLFRDVLDRHAPELEARLKTRFEVTFSIQDRSTDTVAADSTNEPFRLADGSILFRPGGHGALLKNLADLGGDVVFVKNIDNVVPDDRKGPTLLWKRLLAGHLVSLEEELRKIEAALAEPVPDPALLDAALAFLEDELATPGARALATAPPAERARYLAERFARPLRVCGVVKNQGEPGGGPFWVASRGRVSGQIVESSQVDPASPEQQAIWASSTHFNPVDLVVSLRDGKGTPHDLSLFLDPETVFISRKSKDGRELQALERPGLWNGAMAHWNTVFVEVPIETFAPVKTVLDLLRAEHRRSEE